MLMRTDPFREIDHLTQQLLGTTGTTSRPTMMLMDVWRDGDTENITATYTNGVLALAIPVAESAKPRKIEIGRGDDAKSITT